MPVTPTYPGVYIEEVPSGVRTIVGVATSVTAFVGRARKGPTDQPVVVNNFGEYVRTFGEQWRESTMSYAVQHFFQNGGSTAVIVRVDNGSNTARTTNMGGGLVLSAASPGSWGRYLRAKVDNEAEDDTVFNLTVWEVGRKPADDSPQEDRRIAEEVFRNVSHDSEHPRFVQKVVDEASRLARVTGLPTERPSATTADSGDEPRQPFDDFDGSAPHDGAAITATQVTGSETGKTGYWALLDADIFNILCIPPYTPTQDIEKATWEAAAKFCEDQRAVLLIDPPAGWSKADDASSGDFTNLSANAALYFPRVRMVDSQQDFQIETFAPCGVVAGVMARTDAQRGVWKAPAGQEATLSGVQALSVKLTDGENGRLNPIGVNCLRTFPVTGRVVWGARTLKGADRLASEWKYIPVRRTALFIEETLFRNLKWVVFEPNDEPLWAQIRLNVGAFMHSLFRQGAFQGTKPRDAYLVKCDAETTTQDDINRGVVNVLVGFAPLKPAEFVIIKIQQLAGQVQA